MRSSADRRMKCKHFQIANELGEWVNKNEKMRKRLNEESK